jgi:hypothetical protein
VLSAAVALLVAAVAGFALGLGVGARTPEAAPDVPAAGAAGPATSAGGSVGALTPAGAPTPAAAETRAGVSALRPGEAPGPPEAVHDGDIRIAVLGWGGGLVAVWGPHADWLADGQYCRFRLRLENAGLQVQRYEAAAQELLTEEHGSFRANLNAVQISDQPVSLELRRSDAQEFDVWFDIPKDAVAVALRLRGRPESPGTLLQLPPVNPATPAPSP